MNKITYIIVSFLLISVGTLFAQEIKKEVYVISSFKPEVADADKISSMPIIDDTLSLEMEKDYTVLPSRLKTDFVLRPIKSATMVGTPLDKLYKSYLKLGIGNYTTPLAEYSIHNLRSKEYAVGAFFLHKSSHSKITLEDERKVPAGYGLTQVSGYGKYFLKGANVSADAGFKSHALRQYGIDINDPEIWPDSVEINVDDIKQRFTTLYAQADLESTVADSETVNYSLGVHGEFLKDHFDNKEPFFNGHFALGMPVKGFRLGLTGNFDLHSLSDSAYTFKDQVVTISPSFEKRSAEWEVKLAAKIVSDDSILLFPDASLRFQVINKALITYFGITGGLDNNSYQSITSENPFVLSGLNVKNTTHRFIFYAGLDGLLSSKAGYRVSVKFDQMLNAPFFVNDTITKYRNQFDVVYDDVDAIRYHAELYWTPLSYLAFESQFDYNDYKMFGEDKPWHKPAAVFSLSTRYNFKQKIYADFDLVYHGKCFARNFANEDKPFELDAITDLNLKLEYKYSNVLTGFLHFYNILSQKYQYWNQYPAQRINVLVGVTYKF